MKKVLIAFMAAAAFCSCAKNELPGDGTTPWNGGDEAYLNIRISDASALTKAPGDETVSGDFKYGTEHDVISAKFYFYDGNGHYVAEANVWNGGTATEKDQNIEFNGNYVGVLRGLTEKTFPKYVVTLLNAPAGFQPAVTLEDMEKVLAGGFSRKEDDNNYFIMSTTSFAGQTDAEGKALPYFVTEVKEENFANEPVAAEIAKPVVIYVERLAAKVTLGVSSSLAATENGLYKLNVTVSGDLNDEGGSVVGGNGESVEIGATDIYVKFLGWGLNATAKDSYMMKNISESWTDGELGFAWNDAANFRSYWGMSYNYGNADYASTLEYRSANMLNNVIGGVEYCSENTTTAEYAGNRDAVTGVILKAEICDADGNPLEDLVRYNGILYTADSFLKYVLGYTEGLPYYKEEVEGSVKYTRIGAEHVELVAGEDGCVYVQMKGEGLPLLFADNNGETEITDFTAINDSLKAFEENHGKANGYKDGLMYYNIPVQHFRPLGEEVLEANYGIVRNHLYSITVNSLTKIGKGIYNPDENIVPDKDDEKESYYVGAQINILSWKIVNQGVDL